jgi:hypothetical protein
VIILKNKKVALIAIAKDEDTYIHEWVHHHLYLGFSPIFIGVNRTSDKTYEIISKISNLHHDIYVYDLDWIDKGCVGLNKNIQHLGYSYLTTKIDSSMVDYVGFLDIDEYWFNVDNKKIQDFINENKPFDIASFYWLCQFGEDSEFLPPFIDVLYTPNLHVKSIISTTTIDQIEVFSAHVPTYKINFYSRCIHIDQKGNNISKIGTKNLNNSPFPINQMESISTCILHRMMRSEREYLSLVFRGRPNGQLIKSNGRYGFKKGELHLPTIFDVSYYDSLNNFIKECHLLEILIQARHQKLIYYKNKIKNMNENQLITEFNHAKIALTGTIGLEEFVDTFINKVKNVHYLKVFAISLESLEVSLSIKLMQRAYSLKPTGIILKKKLDEYHGKSSKIERFKNSIKKYLSLSQTK